jgi:hypothetical protein
MLPFDERSRDARDDHQDNKHLHDQWRSNRKFSEGFAGNLTK